MNSVVSFFTLYYILEYCYFICKEDDLGLFLGAISPELWSDGLPMDLSVYHNWKTICESSEISKDNVLQIGIGFIEAYEKKFKECFEQTLDVMRRRVNDEVILNSILKAQHLYQSHDYDTL